MMTFEVLAIFLLATLAASIPPPPNDVIAHRLALPPQRSFSSEDGGLNERRLLRAINATLLKYHSDIILPPLKTVKLNATIPTYTKRQTGIGLQNDNDLLYTSPVDIGNPNPQHFTMDFDTGSSDIIIPGPSCGPAEGCTRATKYRETGTELKHNATYVYGGGNATGNEFEDYVTVAGLTVMKQGLMSVSKAPFFATGANNYDGLFGMAFTGASGSNAITFMENLIQNKQISTPEFSFYLGRSFNGTTGADSSLTLGGRDPSKFTSAILQIPVVNKTAWVVALDSITVDSRSAGPSIKGLAAIDTGTSFIVVPVSALKPIFSLIPGAVPIPLATTGSNKLIMYAYPCSTPPKYIPTIRLNGTAYAAPFTIDPQDFSLGNVDGTFAESLASAQGVTAQVIAERGLCLASMLGVQDNVNPDLYVLGTPFLKTWYSVFNFGDGSGRKGKGPWVGFARSLNCEEVGCED